MGRHPCERGADAELKDAFVTEKKFGPNGSRVASFLDDVRNAGPMTWRAYLALPLQSRDERKAATRATGEVRLPASVSAAIGKESLRAFRETGITSDMFPDKKARFLGILSDVELACTAIAAGEKMNKEHVITLLEQFAEAGFGSAQTEVARVGAGGRSTPSPS